MGVPEVGVNSAKAAGCSGKAIGAKTSETLVRPRLRLVRLEQERDAAFARQSATGGYRKKPSTAGWAATDSGSRAAKRPGQRRQDGVAKKSFEPRKRVVLVTAAFSVLVVSAVAAGQVMLTQAAYWKSEAEHEREAARAEYERALAELAANRAPSELERRAREELGMTEASPHAALAMGPSEPPPQISEHSSPQSESASAQIEARQQPREAGGEGRGTG